VIGDIAKALAAIAQQATPRDDHAVAGLRQAITDELAEYADSTAFPMKPQKIAWDLRQVLAPRDIVISDVGAHKMWMARMYQPEQPNTCIISNGFASMGIGLPGAIAARLAFGDRAAVTVTGDAGFLMNSQEIETALRIGTPIVILVWNDSGYGLIKWHQLRRFGRPSHVDFKNPDFVKYAESFGAKGYRVKAADELVPVLAQALADETVVVIDCPVDYSENRPQKQVARWSTFLLWFPGRTRPRNTARSDRPTTDSFSPPSSRPTSPRSRRPWPRPPAFSPTVTDGCPRPAGSKSSRPSPPS
jgi:acetolactate synthase-1/2/3 large subunit